MTKNSTGWVGSIAYKMHINLLSTMQRILSVVLSQVIGLTIQLKFCFGNPVGNSADHSSKIRIPTEFARKKFWKNILIFFNYCKMMEVCELLQLKIFKIMILFTSLTNHFIDLKSNFSLFPR